MACALVIVAGGSPPLSTSGSPDLRSIQLSVAASKNSVVTGPGSRGGGAAAASSGTAITSPGKIRLGFGRRLRNAAFSGAS